VILLQDNELDTIIVGDDTGPIGLINYVIEDDVLVITHTEVDEAYQGAGYGAFLVSSALGLATLHQYKQGATCPYAIKYFEKHGIENHAKG